MADNDTPQDFEFISVEPMEKAAQVDIAEQLQAGLLRMYLTRLKNGTLSDTGAATLQRLLQGSGWTLDPTQVNKGLKSLLTTEVNPREEFGDDPDVVGKIA